MFEDPTLISMVILTSFLSITTIALNLYVFRKLPLGELKDFSALVLSVILVFSLGGFLRSAREIFDLTSLRGINIVYVEYSIYTLTYIVAIYKIREITKAGRK